MTLRCASKHQPSASLRQASGRPITKHLQTTSIFPYCSFSTVSVLLLFGLHLLFAIASLGFFFVYSSLILSLFWRLLRCPDSEGSSYQTLRDRICLLWSEV